MPSLMQIRLIMTLVVRDEADLIQDQIRYHRAQGVDHFLVIDHRSLDATPELLQPFIRAGWLTLFHKSSLARYQGEWVTSLARLAAKELQADWVINNDADEFWWSEQGLLKEVFDKIPEHYRLAVAQRHNFVACTAHENQRFWQNQYYRQIESVNFLGQPLSAKLCHRGEAGLTVHHGNHSVAPMQKEDIWPESAFEIFHFPVRTYAQFESKVRNGGGSWVANRSVSQDIGEGKRSLYMAYLTGTLKNTYTDWFFDGFGLNQALKQKQLCQDKRLRNFMLQLTSDNEK